MNFSELEQLMSSRGIASLAEIARTLKTTPQAVSNWKSRDQIPHHIVASLNKISQSFADSPQTSTQPPISSSQVTNYASPSIYEEGTISLSDILLTMAEQLKIILLVPFISIFITFTYVQFIQAPEYVSWATVLLPENKAANLGGLAGLASQFGVNVPTGVQADLSSPSLFPELLGSRTFAEQILDKKFYTKKYNKNLSLLAILTYGDNPPNLGRDTLVTMALSSLKGLLEFNQDPNSTFSVIRVTASESVFAKELAEVVLNELEDLSQYFKSQTTNEKITFINNRITSVGYELEKSEQRLKQFNERNRQVSSPALQLELERLTRDMEIQKGIYLTLKQQLELAKIDEVQEASVIQVLDKPVVALIPSNKNLVSSIIISAILGIAVGIFLAFVRSYFNTSEMDERRKLRRVRNFIRKKGKDVVLDRRISGIISLLLLMGSPFYLGYQSQNPVFFGMYSARLMLINTIYVLIFFISFGFFIYITRTAKQK